MPSNLLPNLLLGDGRHKNLFIRPSFFEKAKSSRQLAPHYIV
jgi:hypothetical protein